MSEIDHEYTHEIVCPWCGNELGDSWEYDDNGQEWCDDCGNDFTYTRDIAVTYSSEKVEKSGTEQEKLLEVGDGDK